MKNLSRWVICLHDHRPSRVRAARCHFTDDHEPAHVHVFGDGQAKINLVGKNGAPELIWVEAMKHSEVRHAMRVVIENQDRLLARWREIHG